MVINVVDSIMGSGKTSAVINYINKSSDDDKFMYVTPYKTEVDRIVQECSSKHFKQPDVLGTKLNGLKELLKKGRNVATTHALFHLFDDEVIELCISQGYKLFMDEVTEVVSPFDIDKDDLQVLLKEFVDVDEETHLLKWREEKKSYGANFKGVFTRVKILCDNECLAIQGNNLIVWMFPVKVFKAFEESYILTYKFEAQMQKCYYDFYHLEYHYMYVKGDSLDTYELTDETTYHESQYNYKELIHVIDNDKLNMIGKMDYSLSKSWYTKHQDDILMTTLKKNMVNFFTNIVDDNKSSNNMWTTFMDFKNVVKGKGYTKGFIPSNARATNEHRHKHNIAYPINKFFNPFLKQFFIQNGIPVHEDDFALSELLQFIWRSAIRDGEPIYIYIPSRRMRELLVKWIDENSNF